MGAQDAAAVPVVTEAEIVDESFNLLRIAAIRLDDLADALNSPIAQAAIRLAVADKPLMAAALRDLIDTLESLLPENR